MARDSRGGVWAAHLWVAKVSEPTDLTSVSTGLSQLSSASAAIVFRPDFPGGLFAKLTDKGKVQALVRSLQSAYSVGRNPEAYPVVQAETHFLDAERRFITRITDTDGLVSIPGSSGNYLLRDNVLNRLLGQLDWTPGWVTNGVVGANPSDSPMLAHVPDECLRIPPGLPVDGNVVDRHRLRESVRVEVFDPKSLLLALTRPGQDMEVNHILGLLAAAPPAGPVSIPATEEWYMNPHAAISFWLPGKAIPVDVAFCPTYGLLWSSETGGGSPECVYRMTTELDLFFSYLLKLTWPP